MKHNLRMSHHHHLHFHHPEPSAIASADAPPPPDVPAWDEGVPLIQGVASEPRR